MNAVSGNSNWRLPAKSILDHITRQAGIEVTKDSGRLFGKSVFGLTVEASQAIIKAWSAGTSTKKWPQASFQTEPWGGLSAQAKLRIVTLLINKKIQPTACRPFISFNSSNELFC